jgi:glycosyltransferase involved in cell wall biosynthesis
MGAPTISVAMPAYQAARWIGETLESVLAQTSPPDEVVVVDDGSTDRTAEIAASFGDPVRVVRQENGGAPAAYNRAFRESTGEYVAMCPADDLWEPRKLEWQREALTAHPEVDVAFGGARYFGLEDRDHPHPAATGVLERDRFLREMYVADVLPAPTAVVRRALYERLGEFREDLPGEDYEFWMRALRHGAVFFNDSRQLVRLRQHGGNLSAQVVPMWEMNLAIHEQYAEDVGDPALARGAQALDLRTIGRGRLGLGDVAGARTAYRASLSRRPHPAAIAWSLVLFTPGAATPLRWLAARRRSREAAGG